MKLYLCEIEAILNTDKDDGNMRSAAEQYLADLEAIPDTDGAPAGMQELTQCIEELTDMINDYYPAGLVFKVAPTRSSLIE